MANARKCTPELVEDAVKLKKNGMSNVDIAACVGVGKSTFYGWLADPQTDTETELLERLKESEAEFKGALRGRIIAKSRDNWQAAAWMLERMYPEEYAKPEVRLAHFEAERTAQTTDELSKSLKELADKL